MFNKPFKFLLLIGILDLAPPALAQTEANPFFDDTVVQRINLTVGASDWASLLQNYKSDTYYSASFTWNGILEELASVSMAVEAGAGLNPTWT
jgi:hypothetical protein